MIESVSITDDKMFSMQIIFDCPSFCSHSKNINIPRRYERGTRTRYVQGSTGTLPADGLLRYADGMPRQRCSLNQLGTLRVHRLREGYALLTGYIYCSGPKDEINHSGAFRVNGRCVQ